MKLVRAQKGYRKVGDKWLLAKKCSKCGRWLVANTANFYKSKSGKYGLRGECKECISKKCRAKDNPINTDPSIIQVCTCCGKEYPATTEFFHKHKSGKYGLTSRCKDCVAEHGRQYRESNKDKIAERHRQYYQNNKDKITENTRQYYQNNKDKVAESHRQWKENNPEKLAEYNRRWNEKRRQARIDAIIAQKRAEYEAERAPLVTEKTCNCCGRTLPASEFYANKKSKDHLQNYCKECHNKKAKERYYQNLENKGWA